MSTLEAEVIASGYTTATGALIALDATLGQAIVGQVSSSPVAACWGFWCQPSTWWAEVAKGHLIYQVSFGQAGIIVMLVVWLAVRAALLIRRYAPYLYRRNP